MTNYQNLLKIIYTPLIKLQPVAILLIGAPARHAGK